MPLRERRGSGGFIADFHSPPSLHEGAEGITAKFELRKLRLPFHAQQVSRFRHLRYPHSESAAMVTVHGIEPWQQLNVLLA